MFVSYLHSQVTRVCGTSALSILSHHHKTGWQKSLLEMQRLDGTVSRFKSLLELAAAWWQTAAWVSAQSLSAGC